MWTTNPRRTEWKGWVSGDVNDYSQGDRVEGMGESGCDAQILETLAYTTPSIQLNVATLYKTKLLSPRRSLRARGRGFPPGYNECGSWLLLLDLKEIWNQKTSLAVRFPTYMYCCLYTTTWNLSDNPESPLTILESLYLIRSSTHNFFGY